MTAKRAAGTSQQPVALQPTREGDIGTVTALAGHVIEVNSVIHTETYGERILILEGNCALISRAPEWSKQRGPRFDIGDDQFRRLRRTSR